MKIGLFADAHDHVDNVRRAVAHFNREECDLVLFAGDFCSPIVIPPLRKLNCRMIACFGDNDANPVAIEGGMRIIGDVGHPPMGIQVEDGTRILLTHELSDLQDEPGEFDVVVYAHTHRCTIKRDDRGRLHINPGEASGWTYRSPCVVILDTTTSEARRIDLPPMPKIPDEELVAAEG